nr:hypothetical protein [Tanacetum cinerariifolium]
MRPPPSPPPSLPPTHQQPRPPNIFLPTFDVLNSLDWIFQAGNYFTYYAIPPDQRLSLSVFYFTGDALSWYKHLSNNNLLSTWPEFIRALETRFGPSTYENHHATLFKLRQTSTVASYQTKFERISNCVTGLSNEALRNCFIFELRTTKKKGRRPLFLLSGEIPPRSCVYTPQFLLIAGNECKSESDVIPDSGFFHIEDTSPEHTEIPTANEFQTPHFLALSDAAYFGLKSTRAVRVTGYIQGQPVTILVDCGSTHNIIQPQIASLLTMAPTKINPFPVMVGNRQFLECNSLFPSTPLDINKTQFHVPLFVIPVAGADVVLGLAWLSSLGTIIADFAIPQLSFTFNNKQITLRGELFSSLVSPSSLHSLLKRLKVVEKLEICCNVFWEMFVPFEIIHKLYETMIIRFDRFLEQEQEDLVLLE